MKTILGYIFNFFTSLAAGIGSPFGLIWTICTIGIGLFKFVNAMWAVLLAKVVTMTVPTALAPSAMSGLGFLDYVFPLHECFTYMVSFGAFYLLCTTIRMVKSIIPTVA